MNEREYLRLRRQIEDEAKRKLEALDLVWKMVSDPTAGSSSDDEGNPIRRGAIEAGIRRLIPKLAGRNFGPREVRELLEGAEPTLKPVNRSTVSSALKRLADEGVILVKEAGRGKRPTSYATRVVNPAHFVADDIEPDPEPLGEPVSELTDDDIPF